MDAQRQYVEKSSFGNGNNVVSKKRVSIPCKTADERVNIETCKVKSETTLLLSKDIINKADTKQILTMIKSIYLVKVLIYYLHKMMTMLYS